jgi:hypothetical protein
VIQRLIGLTCVACHHRWACHDTFTGNALRIVVAKIPFTKFFETRMDLVIAAGQTTYAPASPKSVTNVLEASADPTEGGPAREPLKRYDVPQAAVTIFTTSVHADMCIPAAR